MIRELIGRFWHWHEEAPLAIVPYWALAAWRATVDHGWIVWLWVAVGALLFFAWSNRMDDRYCRSNIFSQRFRCECGRRYRVHVAEREAAK